MRFFKFAWVLKIALILSSMSTSVSAQVDIPNAYDICVDRAGKLYLDSIAHLPPASVGVCNNKVDVLDLVKGNRGPRGEEGARGPRGLRGAQGEDGTRGQRGEQGERGPRGLKGPKGDDGEPGSGKAGPRGPAGAQGPKGDTGLTGATGATGPAGSNGAPGADGADGQLRIFGDGSAGALMASTGTLTSNNLQYTDITIPSGVTLTVRSGTTIRCSGNFLNGGTILIQAGAAGGKAYHYSAGDKITREAESGVALSGAGAGADAASFDAHGGFASVGLADNQSASILNAPIKAGGGGAAGYSSGSASSGGSGGGSITIICRGTVENLGSITANGAVGDSDGAGGGAGGIIVLASKTSVINSGSITAEGGNGAAAGSGVGGGGGGGGGIIHMLAPSVTAGTRSVLGGSGGALATSSTAIKGGGAGGACGGAGGEGGTVLTNSPGAGLAGINGDLITTTTDPTALF